tara:strand:+ start:737 stop:1315 length:579 start_codon:yes stop_codon:yes gene_type:complete
MSADISKLKDILSKSKAIMKKTEENLGGSNTSNSNSNYVNENEEKEIPNLTEEFAQKYGIADGKLNKSVAPKGGRYPNMKKSKMPDAIKQAMMETPIDIPEDPFSVGSFDLDDVAELVEEPKQIVRENKKPKSSNINTDTIRQIVREEIEDVVRGVVSEYLDKSLVTEDIQIKVGETIFSGNLKPLPKKRKK